MFKPADLPTTLPLFPLPRALLLPRSRLPLNIFEPRYLAMLEDVLKTRHRLIGMVQPVEGGQPGENHAIGCAGRVVAFSETDDKRYMITLGAVSRFRITATNDGFTPYQQSDVDWAGYERDLGSPEKDAGFERVTFLKRLTLYFETAGLSSDWKTLAEADDELLINSLSMLCPFGVEDKQALLEAETLSDRREVIETLIEFAVRGGENDGTLQ